MSLYYSDANKNLHKVAGNIILPTNVERVELVYNKDSANPNINWGYTNGIATGDSDNFISHDFTKYKRLRCNVIWRYGDFFNQYSGYGTIEVDLQQLCTNGYEGANTIIVFFEGNQEYLYSAKILVSPAKDGIRYKGFYSSSNGAFNNTNAGYLTKIEGIY